MYSCLLIRMIFGQVIQVQALELAPSFFASQLLISERLATSFAAIIQLDQCLYLPLQSQFN